MLGGEQVRVLVEKRDPFPDNKISKSYEGDTIVLRASAVQREDTVSNLAGVASKDGSSDGASFSVILKWRWRSCGRSDESLVIRVEHPRICEKPPGKKQGHGDDNMRRITQRAIERIEACPNSAIRGRLSSNVVPALESSEFACLGRPPDVRAAQIRAARRAQAQRFIRWTAAVRTLGHWGTRSPAPLGACDVQMISRPPSSTVAIASGCRANSEATLPSPEESWPVAHFQSARQ